ncbi:electron transfer flavoprotein, beta subunit [Cantharellus anzutake]|uniref:electron transfer flavoprotein, beta subunit n=1 Tax=Cantharellus anzutake TaxID=1750568 RepID=UPI00190686DE|nr:electron transfer flavoprotein, beta subunit [Cantharellus anzutake]KAF8330602.1 electron transfer flavoprotein, beta subunit [Cantharellus anzutake]
MRPTPILNLRVLVPVKRCVDYAVKIRVNAAQTGVDTNVKHSMNPFDEIAIEEGVRLRERAQKSNSPFPITNITALTIGPPKSAETLRTALALGADSAIHVETAESNPLPEPLTVAKVIQAIIQKQQQGGEGKEKEKVDLVIMGKQAIDDDAGQTGQILAGLLGWGQATFVSRVDVREDGQGVDIMREVDGGAEELSVRLPVVITTDLRLNEPRFASLPNIMKAKKKPIEKITPSDLGINFEPAFKTLKVTEPPTRKGGQKTTNIEEVAKILSAHVAR